MKHDKTYKVSHLTSVHPRYDTRIFFKECTSLAQSGYLVSLVVADGKGDEEINTISIVDVGAPKGRFDRILNTSKSVYKKALELDADIYHLHDPELIPFGLKLKRLGKIVIFDSHEDVPKQILSKPYLNPILRYALGVLFSIYEKSSCKKMDAIVAATPFIRDKFLQINPNSVDINNFPIFDELQPPVDWSNKTKSVCYIGGIEIVRGIKEIVVALEHVNSSSRLQLAGKFSDSDTKEEVKAYKGWQSVDELGFLDRSGVKNVLATSMAGLVTLHPIPNYLDALPVKMFEYMSAGIPVIASNFPYWINIVETNNCGLCVDPLDPIAIANSVDYFINNPVQAQQMGDNGRNAILREYNWSIEENKLQSLYTNLCKFIPK